MLTRVNLAINHERVKNGVEKKWMESLWSGETKTTNQPRFLRIFWLQEEVEKKIKIALGTRVTTNTTKISRFSWKQDLRVLLNICNEIFRF